MKIYVGRRVKSKRNVGKLNMDNQIGTVIWACEGENACVQFDNYIDGHRGSYRGLNGKDGHCWFIGEEYLVTIDVTIDELNNQLVNKKITIEEYEKIKEGVVN